MNVERLLVEALAEYDRVQPAPDLYRRVVRSLEEDRAHRARVRRWASTALVATAAPVVAVWQVSSTRGDVVVALEWAFGVIELVLVLGLVVALGPAIRRFGSILVAAVFPASDSTARAFLRLLDVAYYLVFTGYALLGVSVPPVTRTVPVTVALDAMAERVALLLLLMGVMHAVTIAALPVLGMLHASTVRRHRRTVAGAAAPPPHPEADAAERIVRRVVWVVACVVVGAVTIEVIGLVVAALVGIAG